MVCRPWAGSGGWRVPLTAIGQNGYAILDDPSEFFKTLTEPEMRSVRKAERGQPADVLAGQKVIAFAAVRYNARQLATYPR